MADSTGQFLTVNELAKLVRRSTSWVYLAANDKSTGLHSVRVGRSRLFPRESVLAWVRAYQGEKIPVHRTNAQAEEPEPPLIHAQPRVIAASLDVAIEAKIENALQVMKVQFLRELGEAMLSMARGAAAIEATRGLDPTEHVTEIVSPRRPATTRHHSAPKIRPDTRTRSRDQHSEHVFDKIWEEAEPILTKIFHDQCSHDGETIEHSGTLESMEIHRRNTTQYQRVKAFIDSYKTHGIERTKKEWRYLCHGCAISNPPGRLATHLSTQKGRLLVYRILGKTCSECTTPIVYRNSALLDGPGKDPVDRLEKFVTEYYEKGEESVKKHFAIICRTCATKGGVGFAGKPLSATA